MYYVYFLDLTVPSILIFQVIITDKGQSHNLTLIRPNISHKSPATYITVTIVGKKDRESYKSLWKTMKRAKS
jgi:hypothetical protein